MPLLLAPVPELNVNAPPKRVPDPPVALPARILNAPAVTDVVPLQS